MYSEIGAVNRNNWQADWYKSELSDRSITHNLATLEALGGW